MKAKKAPTKLARRENVTDGDTSAQNHRGSAGTRVQARDIGGLLASLREVIQTARQQALRAVDVVQVRTCWSVGRHIVEFEQGGASRAAYGKRLLADLAENLTAEFGKGFDASNLRYMRLFYQAFPNCDALRHELSWTHYRSLLRVEDAAARLWYMNEAAAQNWNTRALDRQIGTLYYERLLASQDRQPVEIAKLRDGQMSTDFVFRDPYLFDLLGLTGTCLPWLGQVPGLEEGGSKA